MLSYASVRSTVMQVEMASPAAAEPLHDGGTVSAAIPGMNMSSMDMAGMAMPHAKPARPHAAKHGSSGPATCPYCSVAAHMPILGGVALFRVPTAFTFAAFRVVASHGPRGPPALQPRARGPPTDPLTL